MAGAVIQAPALPVRAARTAPYASPYRLLTAPVRAAHWLACAALLLALYGCVRGRPVQVRPYVRQAGTGRRTHPSMRQVRVLGPVPEVYSARTWAGHPRCGRDTEVAGLAPWPTLTGAAGYARTRGRVQRGGREVSPHLPRRLKGEQGRQLRQRLAARDGARCLYCGRPDDPAALTLDHYMPLAWARRHRWRRVHETWNLVLACKPCNEAKGGMLPWPLAVLLLARFQPARADLAAAA